MIRAFSRLPSSQSTIPGNACKKLGNLEEAKKSFEKALTEHRTPEYRTALSETESLLKKKAEEAYIDPAISETEKQVCITLVE